MASSCVVYVDIAQIKLFLAICERIVVCLVDKRAANKLNEKYANITKR